MSKCPFWSTSRENISCYSECPMQISSKFDENCPFIELSIGEKITYKDLIEEDLAYSTDNLLAYDFKEQLSENY